MSTHKNESELPSKISIVKLASKTRLVFIEIDWGVFFGVFRYFAQPS